MTMRYGQNFRQGGMGQLGGRGQRGGLGQMGGGFRSGYDRTGGMTGWTTLGGQQSGGGEDQSWWKKLLTNPDLLRTLLSGVGGAWMGSHGPEAKAQQLAEQKYADQKKTERGDANAWGAFMRQFYGGGEGGGGGISSHAQPKQPQLPAYPDPRKRNSPYGG